MSKEIVHFTYDVPFVVATSIKILVEKKLYSSKNRIIEINGYDYDRAEVKNVYSNDIVDSEGLLMTKSMDYLTEILPSGGTIDDKVLKKVSDKYLINLVLSKLKTTYFTNHSDKCDGYVVCSVLNKKINCSMGEHYDVVVALLCDFFGADNIDKGHFSNKELSDFVRKNITISSSFSTAESIANDIEYEGIPYTSTRNDIIRRKYSI